jgi:surface antigen
VETLTSSELQLYISIDRGERHIMQHKKDKLSHWLLSSVGLPAILVPLLLVATGSIVTAQEFKPKQLIAQSCRNIEIRPQPRRNITLPKGTLRVTCGYKLRFQSDGNLVLADKSEKALWATGTEGRGERLVMQADGNLVIYDSGNKPLWATNTSGNPGAFFAIQGDGNLVIYKADGKALWASGTDGGQARTRSAASEWQQASEKTPPPYMEEYFQDGNLIRISNISGQTVNLHYLENGKMINSWNLDPNDDDQKFRVTRKAGTNQIKLVRRNSYYLISAQDSFSDQSTLESWQDVGGFSIAQTWYVDVANTPGAFWLKPIGKSEHAMNLPFGANNHKLTLSKFNPNDPDQKFSVTVLERNTIPINPPPPPPPANLSPCKSNGYECTSGGYTGVDPWGFHNSSSIDGAGRKHNCTAYVAFRAAQNGQANPGYLGNANTWSANARAKGIRVDANATVGSIANRTVGEFGHVAYVEAVTSDGVWISEDNYGFNYTARRFVPFSSGYFQSYIHFGGR